MRALYPNQEADRSRDMVMHEHISKLKLVISPGHKDLKIPQKFRYECPWPSAQVNKKNANFSEEMFCRYFFNFL
jgi:hypothetical protein